MKITLIVFAATLFLLSACGTQCPAGTTQSGDFCLSGGGAASTVGGAIYPYGFNTGGGTNPNAANTGGSYYSPNTGGSYIIKRR